MTLNISPEALEWIKIQRTHLADRVDIVEAFEDEITREANDIADYLPDGGRVLSIGGGMCGTELMIYREYWRRPCDLSLVIMDKTAEGQVRAGFGSQMTPFSNTDVARDFLISNHVEHDRVIFHDPDPALEWTPFDLVVSFLSWCHHYPAETYIEMVYRNLRRGGRVIVDVRKNTDAELIFVRNRFKRIAAIPLRDINYRKSDRMVFEKL